MTPLGRSKRAKSGRTDRLVLRDANVRFFYDHAGSSYDPKTETKEQGRRRRAEALAKAEAYAAEQGYIFSWSPDPEGCIGGDCGETDTCDHPCCQGEPHDCRVCIMYDADGETVLTGLGSICEPSAEYCRVVEAELALEVMP